MPCLSNVESFLISSDLIASQLLLEIAHCIPLSPQSVSSNLLISTLIMSSEFFQLISALRSSCRLISAHLMSFHFLRNQLALLWYFVVVHLMSKHLISHQFFLHLPFSLFPKPNKTPQQLFPCIRHEKFRVVVSAVSDPWVRWDTHSKPSRSEAPNYTERLLRSKAFTHSKLSHRESFTHRSFYTQQTFTHGQLLYRASLHREAFTQRSFYTQKPLHTASFYTEKLLHKVREAFIHRKLLHRADLYTEKPIHREAFAHRSFYTPTLLHTDTFTHRNFYTQQTFTHRSFYTEELLRAEAFIHTVSFHTEKP